MAEKIDLILSTLTALTDRLTALESAVARGGSRPAASGDDEIPAEVAEYDALLAENVAPLVAAAGDDAELQGLAQKIVDAFAESRKLLLASYRAKKPSDEELGAAIGPLGAIMGALSDAPRKCAYPALWKALADVVACATWPLQPGPHNHINAQVGSADFWANRARRDYGATPAVAEMLKTIKKGMTAMEGFCKENYKAGVMWTGAGSLAEAMGAAAAAPAAAAKPAAPAPAPAPAAAPAPKAAAAKPAVKPIEKSKKVTENRITFRGYANEGAIETHECTKGDMVVISKCTNAAFKLVGKVNTVRLDGCKGVTLIVDTIISCLECSNCQDCKVQVCERVPTFQMDACQSMQCYLSKAAADFEPEFVTAKSMSMMVAMLPEDEDADALEVGLPEQFVSKIDFKTMTVKTEPAESI